MLISLQTNLSVAAVVVGPATQEVDMLEKMMQAGMSVCRMNFSHGSYEVCLQARCTVCDLRPDL